LGLLTKGGGRRLRGLPPPPDPSAAAAGAAGGRRCRPPLRRLRTRPDPLTSTLAAHGSPTHSRRPPQWATDSPDHALHAPSSSGLEGALSPHGDHASPIDPPWGVQKSCGAHLSPPRRPLVSFPSSLFWGPPAEPHWGFPGVVTCQLRWLGPLLIAFGRPSPIPQYYSHQSKNTVCHSMQV